MMSIGDGISLASETIALCSDIYTIVKEIKELGGGAAMLSSDIQTLEGRLMSYEEQIKNHGRRVNTVVVATLRRAKGTLEGQKKNLNKVKLPKKTASCFSRCWFNVDLYLSSISTKLGEAIASINKDLEDMIKIMDDTKTFKSLLQETAELEPTTTKISNTNNLYVPIQASQKAVFNAVENFDGPQQIVLLYGGVGKGKSTLANHVCWHYTDSGEKGVPAESGENGVPAESGENGVPAESGENGVPAESGGNGVPEKSGNNGAGKRKSILTKYLCVLHRETGENGVNGETGDTGEDLETGQNGQSGESGQNGESGKIKKVFDYVLLVNCAGSSKLNPTNKQHEILRYLCPANLITNPDSEKIDFKEKIEASLNDFFSNGKRILIVLDGVSDRDFMSEMMDASSPFPQVKYLVTSEDRYLCSGTKVESIHMENPSEEEAMKILATLAGLDGGEIPQKLKGIAEQLITATERNPLALASLGSNFAFNRDRTSVHVWKEAYAKLDQILYRPETRRVLGGNRDTPRSLWAALKISIDSLENADAKDILFLQYACKGESIPEEVLRILHGTVNSSSGDFHGSLEDLYSRELLQLNAGATAHTTVDSDDATDEHESRSWTLPTTVKLYMDRHMAREPRMAALFRDLLDDNKTKLESSDKHEGEGNSEIEAVEKQKTEVEKQVAIALCALYFDRAHTTAAVARTATRACTVSKIGDWDATIKDRRRKAIEPLIWYLDHREDVDLGWTESIINCVRQVFLGYVCEKNIDDSNMWPLLKLKKYPSAQLATLNALSDVFSIDDAPLLTSDHLTFFKPLVDMFDEDVKLYIQEAAAKALCNIAMTVRNDQGLVESIVKSTPHLLPSLIRLIKDSPASCSAVPRSDAVAVSQPDAVAAGAAYTLWALARSTSNLLQIASQDGAIASLVRAFYLDQNPELQQAAAGVLRSLAAGPESTRVRILDYDGVLGGLLGALSEDQNPKLQVAAAGVLRSLAAGPERTKVQILDYDGALGGLLGALSKDQNPKLQEVAARALWGLATGPESTKVKILDYDGALGGLLGALSKDQNPKLQEAAALALRSLAAGPESTKVRILDYEGALRGLLGALSKDQNPKLQEVAAGVLNCLAYGEERTKVQILDYDGALRGLLGALSEDQNPKLQEAAAAVLNNLAHGEERTKVQILDYDGALGGLLGALSKDQNPKLQVMAARALWGLATGPESTKVKILDYYGALGGLLGALSEDQNPKLQEAAAWALRSLAVGPESTKVRILDYDGALRGLLGALSKDQNPILQEVATWALGYLTSGHEEIVLLRILGDDRVVGDLEQALSKDQNRELQQTAARAFCYVTIFGLRTISGEDGVLKSLGKSPFMGLLKSLSKDTNPLLQKIAANALLSPTGDLEMKPAILDEDGALGDLAGALSKEQYPVLQKTAAKSLLTLASLHDKWTRKLVEHDGVLRGLVGALSQILNPDLQIEAAKTLIELARTLDRSTLLKMRGEVDLMAALRKYAVEADDPKVRSEADWALEKLEGAIESEVASEES